jgi:hypothetical protein
MQSSAAVSSHGGRNAPVTVLGCNGPVLKTGPQFNFKLNINMFARLKQLSNILQNTNSAMTPKYKIDEMQFDEICNEDAVPDPPRTPPARKPPRMKMRVKKMTMPKRKKRVRTRMKKSLRRLCKCRFGEAQGGSPEMDSHQRLVTCVRNRCPYSADRNRADGRIRSG